MIIESIWWVRVVFLLAARSQHGAVRGADSGALLAAGW